MQPIVEADTAPDPGPPARNVSPEASHTEAPSAAWPIAAGAAGLLATGIGTYILLAASAKKMDISRGGFATGSDIEAAANDARTLNTIGAAVLGVGITLDVVALWGLVRVLERPHRTGDVGGEE